MSEVIIKEYEPAFANAYKQLNLEWIKQYFVVEQHDREQLDNPDEYIISKGGYILFALYDKEVVGTCALIRTGEKEFEMAKMAVSPLFQGKKIGKILGRPFWRSQDHWERSGSGWNRIVYSRRP